MTPPEHGELSDTSDRPDVVWRQDERVYVVRPSGALDFSNVARLQIAALAIPREALGLVLDLSDASFLDSAVMRLIFDLEHDLPRARQVFRMVCSPDSSVARRLALMGFNQRPICAATEADAIEEIQSESARD